MYRTPLNLHCSKWYQDWLSAGIELGRNDGVSRTKKGMREMNSNSQQSSINYYVPPKA
jgi:hypothetical protein